MACAHSWKPTDDQLADYAVGARWECHECLTQWLVIETSDGGKRLVELPD
jgi:hypothetical protein